MSQPLLTVCGITQEFAQVKALDDVSLEIQPKQTYGLVGESGSGKSTLGNIIVGALKPTAGTIQFDGEELGMKREMAQKKAIQMVYQNPRSSLNPRLTIHNTLDEVLVIQTDLSKAERQARIEETIVKVGLEIKHLNKYPHALSGGQCQRVAIARAIIVQPN